MEEKSKGIIKDIQIAEEKNKEILDFFHGKLIPEDYAALRASAFIKYAFDRGKISINIKNS